MSRTPTRSLLAVALAGLLFAAGAQAQSYAGTEPVDRIAAVVNEDVILRSELERAVANIRAQYAGQASQLPPPDVLERQVLERLVLLRLQISRATDAGVAASDEDLENAVQGVAQQNGMSVDQLRERITQDGMSFAEFRTNLRDEIITQKLRQSFAQGRINVSEAEVDAALANASASASQQFHLAHILVGVPDGATPEQLATAQKKIEGVKGLIDKGEMTFAAAAVRYSDSPNALEGGDLGWFGADTYGSAFGMQVAALSDGQTSAPFKTDAGWVIVQRSASRQVAAGNDNLRAQVRETIGRRKLEDEWNRWLREMRGEAFVDVRDAQGNSTTPVPNGPAPKEPHKATLTPEQVQQSASGG